MTDIYKNKIFINGEYFNFDISLNKELVNKVEGVNENLTHSKGLFVNTICFHQLLMNYELKSNLFLERKCKKVRLKYIGFSTSYLFEIFKRDKIIIVKDHYYFINRIIHFLLIPTSLIKIIFYSILSIFYVFFKSLKQNNSLIFYGESLVLIHSNTALNKCMKFCISKNEKGTILYDSHKLKINKNYDNFTVIDLYKIVKSSHLIKVIPELLKSVFKQTKLIYKEFKQIFGVFSRFYVIFIYADRFFHSVYVSFVLDFFVKENVKKIKKIISGEKESRFAIIENNIINKFKIEGVCIPHGLEYNFKYPKPLFGNIFYATSENAKNSLEIMYQNIHFIFDETVLKNIYKVFGHKIQDKKIVFFTDSRNIKLDHFIISFLALEFNDIYVKLHPNDLKDNYSDIENINFVNSFNDSICDNIVLTRNSTVLLEGIYNNSTCISIILNTKDKFISNYLYPSLNNLGIIKIEKLQELKVLIKKMKKNEIIRLYN